METTQYGQIVNAWREQLETELRREYGWLTLVGEFWLKEGVNTLGSSPDCDIHLPRHAPRLLGGIDLRNGAAAFSADIGQTVDINGFSARGPVPLKAEEQGASASMISAGDLRFLFIRREGKAGLRMWDNELARQVPARTWFPVDPKYRVRGSYTPYPVPVKVQIPNSRGEEEVGYVQGSISFKLLGKSCSLDAAELDNGTLYAPFCDATNALRTFPWGRYLYTEPVREDGEVSLDFNLAYNPPCAFKKSEACNFAPPGNHLRIAVEAGELYEARR